MLIKCYSMARYYVAMATVLPWQHHCTTLLVGIAVAMAIQVLRRRYVIITSKLTLLNHTHLRV